MDKASCSINRFDINEGTSHGALPGVNEEDCQVLEVDPNQQRIWTGSESGRITIWSSKNDCEDDPLIYKGQSFIGHPDVVTGNSGWTAVAILNVLCDFHDAVLMFTREFSCGRYQDPW